MTIAVVGAGLAGLMAARRLHDDGHDVVVFERSRSPGGRLATRRIDGAQLDHGAQFFTVRDERFADQVDRWQRDGIVYEWCRGFDAEPDGHPRYAVRGGMNALAKHLARGLDVRCGSLVFSIHRVESSWEVKLDDGSRVAVDALVVTCPLPQSYSLLVSAEVTVPDLLWRTDYERTLALLAVLDAPPALPDVGAVQRAESIQFLADNARKGISAVPAITLHADATWSRAHWDDANDDALRALTELADPYLGSARIVTAQLKRWRFATPATIWPDPFWSPEDDRLRVVLAGDAFAGPRVEGAVLSGLAAAEALLA